MIFEELPFCHFPPLNFTIEVLNSRELISNSANGLTSVLLDFFNYSHEIDHSWTNTLNQKSKFEENCQPEGTLES